MKIAVIGGGYSGMICSHQLSKNKNYEIYLIEQNAKLGRKLLATGGGRCNLGNNDLNLNFYNNPSLVDQIYNRIDRMDIRKYLFDEFYLITRTDEKGLWYPYSNSSKTVLDSIEAQLIKDNIQILLSKKVIDVKKKNKKWNIYFQDQSILVCDKIVVATGGISYKNLGSTGELFTIFKGLGYDYKKLQPSLVGFSISHHKKLSGVRIKGTAKLIVNQKCIHEEYGEIQFKDEGVSGICVLNCSHYLNQFESNKTDLYFDFSPECSREDVTRLVHQDPKLTGYLTEKMAKYILSISKDEKEIVENIKNMHFKVNSLLSYEEAQVTKGGFPFIESMKDSNVFFIGEAVDVDGICGGYNLMWAFISAIYCANRINESTKSKKM